METNNNCVKYVIKGTLTGSKCYESSTETMNDIELVEYAYEIKQLLTGDYNDNLADYLHEDDIIYGVVTEIRVDINIINGRMCSWTEVTANKQLTDEQKTELLDYLSGQFSDGYGEGLEQQEFITFTDTEYEETWDEDEQANYTEQYDVEVSCYLHLWQSHDFKLEFVDANTEDNTPAFVKPRCKLISEDGNIFNLAGIAYEALRRAGFADKAKEMQSRIFESKSYDEALGVIMDYVEVR